MLDIVIKRKIYSGAEGLEPTNGGIKARCLTTWRRPILSFIIFRLIFLIVLIIMRISQLL